MNSIDRIQAITKLLEQEPNDAFLNYALALEYHKSGKLSDAVQLIEKVLQNDESYLGAYLQLGKLYEEQAEVEKALTTYRKGCEVAKNQGNRKTLAELEEALFMLED